MRRASSLADDFLDELLESVGREFNALCDGTRLSRFRMQQLAPLLAAYVDRIIESEVKALGSEPPTPRRADSTAAAAAAEPLASFPATARVSSPAAAAAAGAAPDAETKRATIELAPYSAQWPQQFEAVKRRVQAALGSRALEVHHIGSTAVPGLRAKPVIDVALVVADSAAESRYRVDLERAGFAFRLREPEFFEHRLFKGGSKDSGKDGKEQAEEPLVNLHVYSDSCVEVERLIGFRDWLRAHDADRVRYESTKLELATRDWASVQAYADAKTEIVRDILARAGIA